MAGIVTVGLDPGRRARLRGGPGRIAPQGGASRLNGAVPCRRLNVASTAIAAVSVMARVDDVRLSASVERTRRLASPRVSA